MEKWIIHITKKLKDELGWLLMISFGIFLFILFFQPFPLELFDFNNRLLFITGFGVMTFVLGGILLIFIPQIIPHIKRTLEREDSPPVILGFLFFALNTTAFAFYIRYVGHAELSFYLMYKVALVCFLGIVLFWVLYRFRSLNREISALQENSNYYLSRLGEIENIGEKEEIEILTDSRSDNLKLMYSSILFIKSADNYVELYFRAEGQVEKKLIRSTLKNIESQLAAKRQFIRCHRTCIVNSMHIEKLIRNYSGYSLKLELYSETIPVSRQYLMQVKNAISLKD